MALKTNVTQGDECVLQSLDRTTRPEGGSVTSTLTAHDTNTEKIAIVCSHSEWSSTAHDPRCRAVKAYASDQVCSTFVLAKGHSRYCGMARGKNVKKNCKCYSYLLTYLLTYLLHGVESFFRS